MDAQISRLRSFNRTVTRRIGVLNDRFLGLNRPLGESRVLFEIGADGLEVRELRARLGLDSGYASRLLRALERQGLVETASAPRDARVRFARLTPKGLAELAELDRRSAAAARSILSGLDERQRKRLTAAMSKVEALLLASEIEIAPEPSGSANARWCLEEFGRDLERLFEGGYDPSVTIPVERASLTPPTGVFLIARAGGQPVGCGALKGNGGKIAEIKRLWVAGSLRGFGIGQRILSALEDYAREFGIDILRLDTNKALIEAQALYLRSGYREVPPFNDEPYSHHWFEKRLD